MHSRLCEVQLFPVGGFSGTMFLRAKWVGCDSRAVEVLACVFVFRAGETAGMAKNIEQIRDGCKVASCKTLM